jgi:hypothetical protein
VRSATSNRSAVNVTGVVLLLIGAGLVLLSVLADWLDIGGGEGFGYQQLIVLIIGIVLILGGLRLIVQPWLSRMTRHDLLETDR